MSAVPAVCVPRCSIRSMRFRYWWVKARRQGETSIFQPSLKVLKVTPSPTSTVFQSTEVVLAYDRWIGNVHGTFFVKTAGPKGLLHATSWMYLTIPRWGTKLSTYIPGRRHVTTNMTSRWILAATNFEQPVRFNDRRHVMSCRRCTFDNLQQSTLLSSKTMQNWDVGRPIREVKHARSESARMMSTTRKSTLSTLPQKLNLTLTSIHTKRVRTSASQHALRTSDNVGIFCNNSYNKHSATKST